MAGAFAYIRTSGSTVANRLSSARTFKLATSEQAERKKRTRVRESIIVIEAEEGRGWRLGSGEGVATGAVIVIGVVRFRRIDWFTAGAGLAANRLT